MARGLVLLASTLSGGGGLVVVVVVVTGSEIGGAVAEVVDWRDAVEELEFRFRQLEGHLLREGQQPLEDVELVRKRRRKGQHPAWKSRRGIRARQRRRRRSRARPVDVLVRMLLLLRMSSAHSQSGRIRSVARAARVGRIEVLLQVPQGRPEILERRRRGNDNVPAGGPEFQRHSIVRPPAAQLPLRTAQFKRLKKSKMKILM